MSLTRGFVFSCPMCQNFKAVDPFLLLQHMNQIHTGSKIHFGLVQSSNLRDANYDSDGNCKRKFQCTYCQKSFQSDVVRKIHEKAHTCQRCPELKFESRISLRRHQKIHQRKNFFCFTCFKTFCHRRTLRIHKRVHDKSHTCDTCGRRCLSEISLTFHKKKCAKIHQDWICGKHYEDFNDNVVLNDLWLVNVNEDTVPNDGSIFTSQDFEFDKIVKANLLTDRELSQPSNLDFLQEELDEVSDTDSENDFEVRNFEPSLFFVKNTLLSSSENMQDLTMVCPTKKCRFKTIETQKLMTHVKEEHVQKQKMKKMAKKCSLQSNISFVKSYCPSQKRSQLKIKVNKIQCQYCKKNFRELGKKDVHEKKHNGIVAPIECQFCDRRFTRKFSQESHMKKFHNYDSNSAKKLKKYLDPTPNEESIVPPSTLLKNYQSESRAGSGEYIVSPFKAHKDIETDVGSAIAVKPRRELSKQYVCQFCQKRYAYPKALDNHQKIHYVSQIPESDYSCEQFI